MEGTEKWREGVNIYTQYLFLSGEEGRGRGVGRGGEQDRLLSQGNHHLLLFHQYNESSYLGPAILEGWSRTLEDDYKPVRTDASQTP